MGGPARGGCAPSTAFLAHAKSHARTSPLRHGGRRGAPLRLGRRIPRAPFATHTADVCHGERGCRIVSGGGYVLKNVGSNWVVTVGTGLAAHLLTPFTNQELGGDGNGP